MMWCFPMFMLLYSSSKEIFYVNELTSFSSVSMVMFSLVMLFVYFCYSFVFNLINFYSKYVYMLLYFFVSILCSMCFFFSSPYYFLVSLEVSVILMLYLILYFSKSSDKVSSCVFMISINTSGSILFMFYTLFFSTNFLSAEITLYSCYMVIDLMFFLCFSIMLMLKIPIFIGHFWLTKAHVSASGPSSMILASLMLKIGTFGFYNFYQPLSCMNMSLISLFFSFCYLGCLYMCVMSVRFFDFKLLIAMSSVVHMSMITPLLILGSPVSSFPSLFMMVGHGVVSLMLFYIFTMYYESVNNRSSDFNKCICSTNSSTCLFFCLFMLMNMGIPPMITFLSELFFSFSLIEMSFLSVAMFSIYILLSMLMCFYPLLKFINGKNSIMSQNSFTDKFTCLSSLSIFYILIIVFYF